MIKYANYRKAASFIKEAFTIIPKTAVVLGSGQSSFCDMLSDKQSINYEQIPDFPVTTNKSHAGKMIVGNIGGKPVIVLSGRGHYYEGYSFEQTAFYVTVLAMLGVENLIITNASGGVNRNFIVGDIMIITDHIKFCPESPLIGENEVNIGARFPDMSNAYNKDLIKIAEAVAARQKIALQHGIYMYFAGPQFETPAEVRAAAILGADAVGMSTVSEVIAAARAKIKVLGISIITNMAAGVTNEILDDNDVIKAAALVSDKVCNFIAGVVTII